MELMNLTISLDDKYVAPHFQTTLAILHMHDVPRFGHTEEVTCLFDGDSEARKDYLLGIAFVSIIIFSAFLVWSITLLVKRGNIGCAGGAPPSLHGVQYQGNTGDSSTIESTVDANGPLGNELRKIESRFWRIKLFFLLAGCGVLVSTILLNLYGFKSIGFSIVSANESIKKLEENILIARNITERWIQRADVMRDQREILYSGRSQWCPKINSTKAGQVSNLAIQNALDEFRRLQDFGLIQVASIHNSLGQLVEATRKAQKKLENVSWYIYYTTVVVSILLGTINILLMAGVFFSASSSIFAIHFKWTESYVILPIFIALISILWILSSILALSSVASADICIKSPDGFVKWILDKYFKESLDPILYELILYYITGCREEFKPIYFIRLYGPFVHSILLVIDDIFGTISGADVSALNEFCGADVRPIIRIVKVLHDNISIIFKAAISFLQLLLCSNFNPIYVGIAYDGFCYNGVSGLTWTFCSLLSIAICGMTMITLRVLWYKITINVITTIPSSQELDNKIAP